MIGQQPSFDQLSVARVPQFRGPIWLTSFVGRETEIGCVADLLSRDDVRLVTLTGPGGVGKTRLVAEVARMVTSRFSDGAWFVPLSPIHDPTLVMPAIAETIGIREAGERSVTEVLLAALAERQMLLVLDNFEQVLPAGPEIVRLLATCPDVKVLITSRAVLRVSGEHEVPVLPLAVPSSDDVVQVDAVRLFRDRAAAVQTDFQLDDETVGPVVAICEHLDGLPLAIELAAARLRHLPLHALRERLEQRLTLLSGGARDLPVRLQTMRNAIAWSYDLLDADEQQLFRRLAVFSGGFVLEAAVAVSGKEDDLAVFDSIAILLDNSLLFQFPSDDGESRYGMLETIREFGLERLVSSGEAVEVYRRHAYWCVELAAKAWPAFAGRSNQGYWLQRLDAELDNIRGAIDWLEQHGQVGAMIRLSGCAYWYCFMRGHFSEGASWIARACALPGAESVAPTDRARAWFGAGHLSHCLGDHQRAIALVHRAHAEWKCLQDPWGLGVAPLLLGIIAEDEGRYDDAFALIEDALTYVRAGNDRVNEALALYHLGVVMLGLCDLDRAIQLTEMALEMQRRIGDRWAQGNSLSHLGLYSGLRRQHEQAVSIQQECLRVRLEMGNPPEIALCLACIAVTAAETQQPRLAALLYAVEDRVRKTVGSPRYFPERLIFEESAKRCRNTLGDSKFEHAWAEGQAMSLDDAIALAMEYHPASMKVVAPERNRVGRHSDLTNREIEVLKLVARGLTNPEIAEKLFISPGTARIHVSNILGKLGAKTRTEAADLARRRGLLPS